MTGNLTSGNTKSCGCRKRAVLGESTTKHGLVKHPLYRAWKAMIQRCTNPNNPSYHNYGGRGITVDPAWRNDFAAFFRDMGERPKGHTLERKDNDGPYCKGNCIWATRRTQSRNTRVVRRITVDGVTLCKADWCLALGVSRSCFDWHCKQRGAEECIRHLRGRTVHITA